MDERETNLESAAPRLDASSPCSSSGRVRGGVGVVVRAGARPGSGARPLAGSHRASHLVVPSHASSTVSPRCALSTNMATRARLLAVVDPRGCPRGDWKVRTRSASERARARRPRATVPAAPAARRGPARGSGVRAVGGSSARAATSAARARRADVCAAASHARSFRARSAFGEIRGGPARETDAPRRSIDRDLYGRCGRGRGGVGSETPAASRALPGAAPTAGLPRLRPRLASPRRAPAHGRSRASRTPSSSPASRARLRDRRVGAGLVGAHLEGISLESTR